MQKVLPCLSNAPVGFPNALSPCFNISLSISAAFSGSAAIGPMCKSSQHFILASTAAIIQASTPAIFVPLCTTVVDTLCCRLKKVDISAAGVTLDICQQQVVLG